jgi:mRNA interferase MazF
MVIVRGDVFWVDFSGSRGAEIRKTRPAVVVSNDDNNRHMNTVTVVPLSSALERIRPHEVPIPAGLVGDGRRCKANAHQVNTVDKGRFGRKLGQLPEGLMENVGAALRVHLGL